MSPEDRKFVDDHFMVVHVTGPAKAPAPVCKTELTPEGEQYVIPGAEQKAPAGKPQQFNLWDGKR